MSSGQKMISVSPGPGNVLGLQLMDELDYAKGDITYLVDDPARIYQIRPLLKADMLAGRSYSPNDRMVVGRVNGTVFFRGFIRLPRKARENTPANVQLALKELGKSNPSLALFMRAWAISSGAPDVPEFK